MADMGGFDADKVPESTFDAIPAGDYRACMIESERKPTKAGDGHLLSVKWRIAGGEFNNRTVFDNFNLWNASAAAKARAEKDFAKVCIAVGVRKPGDSNELHGLPLVITLEVGEYNGQPKNEITDYKAATVSKPTKTEAASDSTTSKPAGW